MSLSLWNDPADLLFRPFETSMRTFPGFTNTMTNNTLTKELMPMMSADLIENDNEYQLHVDLPGVTPEDLDISIMDKFLVMKAERKYVHEENVDKVHSMERTFGKVQRKIRIPQNGDIDNIQTKLKNGVLTVTIPKVQGQQGSRKLDIQVEK